MVVVQVVLWQTGVVLLTQQVQQLHVINGMVSSQVTTQKWISQVVTRMKMDLTESNVHMVQLYKQDYQQRMEINVMVYLPTQVMCIVKKLIVTVTVVVD